MRKYHGIEVKDNSFPQEEIKNAPLEVQASILWEALQEALHRYDSFKWMWTDKHAGDEEWYRQLTTIKYSTDNVLLPDEE